jgi:hypothetical protein
MLYTRTAPSSRHLALVDLSLVAYAAHLWDLLNTRSFGNASETAISRLRDLIVAAREKHDLLAPEDFKFVASDLEALDREKELPLLVNPWCLGSFNDGAAAVFMGTEEGQQSKNLGLLSVGNLAYGVSWATGGKPDVLSKISGLPAMKFQADIYHRHPYVIHGQASTWIGIAKVLASASNRSPKSYFNGDAGQPRLGDSVYLIDRSAQPSPTAVRGSEPKSNRVAFLRAVVSALATTARVLVVTGSTGSSASDGWGRINESVKEWFLETKTPRLVSVPDPRLKVFDANYRRVIFSWALGGRARIDQHFIDRLGRLIGEVSA